ncbi:carbohydrate ABC transporter permease, partial [Pseudarthrobacter sp. NPDC058329]
MFRYTKKTFLREALLILVALIFLLPFYFLINLALKNGNDALTTSAMQLVTNPTLEAFGQAIQGGRQATLMDGMLNSIIITAGSVL